LVKGVPPFLVDMKEAYSNASKVQIIGDMLHAHLESMQKKNTLSGEDEEQDPTVELWLMYFLAQHNHFQRNFDKSIEYVNLAIAHTPTVVELCVLKAHIYKRAGDQEYAAKLYDEARMLDKADRFLNAQGTS
jgi:Tfp pilus assembly protein PilF